MKKALKKKYNKLIKTIVSNNNLLIAFSGGVDSTFLLNRSLSILGQDNIMAVICTSETYPKEELDQAEKYCKQNKIKYKLIKTSELKIPNFIKNPPERCYYCKYELFRNLRKIAKKYNFSQIADGSNFDDLKDFRPGNKAKKELGIISPLVDAKITKKDIRDLSKLFNISTFDKPSFACLSSRFPYGTKITINKINQVGKAEKYLKSLGLKTVRVRHHETIARIEINYNDFSKIIRLRSKIMKHLKKIGFTYITLDMGGFRSGSMNEVL